ncbi:MAG: hypothetical protein ACRDZX_17720 [Acidimicrobiales bacterium]
MTITAGAADLARGYEALRAQALGELPALTPRGRAVLMSAGLPAWMGALPPPSRPRAPVTPGAEPVPQNGQGGELVRLLAEMLLASQARCHA